MNLTSRTKKRLAHNELIQGLLPLRKDEKMAKYFNGECKVCKKFRAVDEDWMCGACAADTFVKGDSDTVAKSPFKTSNSKSFCSDLL